MPFSALRFLSRGAALLAALLAVRSVGAEVEAGQPYRRMAERIASVARFVDWPERRFAQPSSAFIIGVVGTDAVFEQLSGVLQGQRLKGHPVVVRHLVAKEDCLPCHLVFVGRSEKDRLEPILRATRREGILTVGESENFLAHGGVMALLTIKDSIRLQVSTEAVQREKLVVSSRLLQLALPPNFEVGASGGEPER